MAGVIMVLGMQAHAIGAAGAAIAAAIHGNYGWALGFIIAAALLGYATKAL